MMVDGKVCNALSDTSLAKCYIYKATRKELNDINNCVRKPTDVKNIHLAYQMKLWQIDLQLELETARRLVFYPSNCLLP